MLRLHKMLFEILRVFMNELRAPASLYVAVQRLSKSCEILLLKRIAGMYGLRDAGVCEPCFDCEMFRACPGNSQVFARCCNLPVPASFLIFISQCMKYGLRSDGKASPNPSQGHTAWEWSCVYHVHVS